MRKYVPELANFDKKYIYEPWKAPIADQKKWGCLVKGGGSEEAGDGAMRVYPKPMFDFGKRRDICIQGMKNAYHVNLYGNSPQVLDGTWRKLFDNEAEGPTEGSKGPPGAMIKEEDHEDAGGHEENMHVDEPPSPKQAKKMAMRSDQKAGQKREASQGTLDGMFTRKKKKDGEIFPNETHFG